MSWDLNSSNESVELDVLTAFLCSIDFDITDQEHCAYLSETAQTETMAFMARSKAKGKGKPMKGFAHGYRPIPSGLSLDDRRSKLREIKAKSTCKACGKKGHWAGDMEFTGSKSGKGSKPSPVAHHVAVTTREQGVQTDTAPWRTQSAAARHDSSSAESDADIAEQVEAAKAHITYYDDDGESEVDHQGFISISDETGYEESAYMGFFNEGDFELSDEELVPIEEEVPNEDLPEGSDTKFNFGQHKGETYIDVLRPNPSHFRWGT